MIDSIYNQATSKLGGPAKPALGQPSRSFRADFSDTLEAQRPVQIQSRSFVVEAAALGDIGQGLQSAGGAIGEVALARARALNQEKLALADLMFDKAELDIAKQAAHTAANPEGWTKLAQTTLSEVYAAVTDKVPPAVKRQIDQDYQRRLHTVTRDVDAASTRKIFSNTLGMLLANADHKAEMGDVDGARQTIRQTVEGGYLSAEAGERKLAALDAAQKKAALEQHDTALMEHLERGDYDGAEKLAQGITALDATKSSVQLGLVQYERAHNQQWQAAQTEVENDPSLFLGNSDSAAPSPHAKTHSLLTPEDWTKLQTQAQEVYTRKQEEEVRSMKQQIDRADLAALARKAGSDDILLPDVDATPLRYADAILKEALHQRFEIKKRGGTLDSPALYQWARTQISQFNPAQDEAGTERRYMNLLFEVSFDQSKADHLKSLLAKRAQEPSPKIPLAEAFRQVDAEIIGGTDYDYFRRRERGKFASSRPVHAISSDFLEAGAPNSLRQRAARAEEIKGELERHVANGIITTPEEALTATSNLIAQKKSTRWAEVYPILKGIKGDRAVLIPPEMDYDRRTDQFSTRYGKDGHEAWEARGSHLFGYAWEGTESEPTLHSTVQQAFEEGLSPEASAQRVREWQAQVLERAGATVDSHSPERYRQSASQLQQSTQVALDALRQEAMQAWTRQTFRYDAERRQAFALATRDGLEASSKSGPFQKESQSLRALLNQPHWKAAGPSPWREYLDDNGVPVANYTFIPRQQGFDVQLNYSQPNGQRNAALLRVDGVSEAELSQARTEATQKAQEAQTALAAHQTANASPQLEWAEVGSSPEVFLETQHLTRQRDETQLRASLLNSDLGLAVLQEEKLKQAVAASPVAAQLGQSNLIEDFKRGWSAFYIGSRMAWNDVSGDDKEFAVWREYNSQLRQILPGSTGAHSGFTADLAEAVGGMAPQLIAAGVSGGVGLASTTARAALLSGGTALSGTTLGLMGASTYGHALAEALDRADQLEQQARLIEAETPEGASQLREEARSLRERYRAIAGSKTVTQMLIERALPEELLWLGGKGAQGTFGRNLLNNVSKSSVEGFAGEAADQFINAGVYGDELNVTQMLKGAALEAAAGSPFTVPGSIPRSPPPTPALQPQTVDTAATTTTTPHPLGQVLQFSQPDGRAAGQAMRDLAADGSRFRRNASSNDPTIEGPASQNTDLGKIVSDYDLGGEHLFVDETQAFNDPSAEVTYEIGVTHGGKAYLYQGKDHTLWLDLTEMRAADGGPVQGGDLVIQAAMTYAHNNQLRWRPDPLGSTEIALARSYSHMLSSALRHQTTSHLAPNATINPKTAQPGIRIPDWKDGDNQEAYEHNIDLLAKAEYEVVRAAMGKVKDGVRLEDLKWNPEDDTITHEPTGSRLSKRAFDQIVSRLDPGRSGVGPTTLSRALVSQAALQGHVVGRSYNRDSRPTDSDRRGDATFGTGESLRKLLEDRKIFYSKSEPVDTNTLGSGFTNYRELGHLLTEAVGHLNRRVPGFVSDRTQVFATVEDLLHSPYAQGRSFTPEQQAQLESAEGFYDSAQGGRSVIIASNIVLRPGETPQTALTRVLLHERVGHEGLYTLLGKDQAFNKRWDRLSQQIPQEDLNLIASEDAYAHLAADRNALTLEWFARQAEKGGIESLQKQPFLRELWDTLKTSLLDLYRHLGLPYPKGKAFDHDLQTLLRQSRKAVLKPSSSASDSNNSNATSETQRDNTDFVGRDAQEGSLAFSIYHKRQQAQDQLAKQAIETILNYEQFRESTTGDESVSFARLRSDRSRRDAQTPIKISTSNLLRTSEGSNLGWDSHGGRGRKREAEIAYLNRYASAPSNKGIEVGSGGEHKVYISEGQDFVTKATHSGKYGQIFDQMGPDEGYRFSLRPALPSEYLLRVGLANKVFGDDIRIIGYENTANGPSIVTSQSYLDGPHPKQEEVDTYLRLNGFAPLDERLYDTKTIHKTKRPWYRDKDGVVVVDAKRQNFIMSDGKVIPVDLMIQIMPDDVLEKTRAARMK